MQIIKILDSALEPNTPDDQSLQENLESLREEKEYWKYFMEVDEWNRDTIREVETAWRKRYSAGNLFVTMTKSPIFLYFAIIKHDIEALS